LHRRTNPDTAIRQTFGLRINLRQLIQCVQQLLDAVAGQHVGQTLDQRVPCGTLPIVVPPNLLPIELS
jgi:hypothetical protein